MKLDIAPINAKEKTYMFAVLKQPIHALGRAYIRKVTLDAYETNKGDPRGPSERSHEYAFALNALRLAPQHQDVLDVGSGAGPFPALIKECGYRVTAIDQGDGYWQANEGFNRHWLVRKSDITKEILETKFGIITCLSVIEHIPNHISAIQNMAKMLKPDGILILSHPYNEDTYIEDIYSHPDAGFGNNVPYRCSIYNRSIVNRWLAAGNLRIIEQRYFAIYQGELWTMGGRLHPTKEVGVNDRHHLTTMVLAPSGVDSVAS